MTDAPVLIPAAGTSPEHLTQEAAARLAERLETYWRKRGFEINATVREARNPVRPRDSVWSIRSDLVRGLPKDWKQLTSK